MTWKVHINQIASKIAKNVGILTRIAYILTRPTRLNLYYTLAYPYLTYCNLVWAGAYATRLSKLVILQKRAVRVVAGIKKCDIQAHPSWNLDYWGLVILENYK